MLNKLFLILFFSIIFSVNLFAQNEHPQLVLMKSDVRPIKDNIGKVPLFDKSLQKAKDFVDKAIKSPMDVPYPKDAGGGYTHEKHKQNYNEMYHAGILYQLTGEEKYVQFIKDMLDQYAEIYPGLGRHPQGKKQTPGRMFWQTLNESVWLLHTIQAYDAVFSWLSVSDRKNYEDNIFTPMVKFFINECKHDFDKVHNHGTWMDAAVGMTGYVMGNEDWVNMALYGSDLSGEAGFLAQLNKLFSPDGYYTEGGYYVRYALWPFFIFAEAIHNNQTDIEIYQYRDQILKKALYSALQVTDTHGAFIPINDALKEKTWLTRELIFATNFVFAHYEQDRQLLSIVKLHDEVSLTGPGLMVAKDIMKDEPIPQFQWESVEYSDGPDGNMGGVGILRNGKPSDQEILFMKYGTHGMGHGHFDKLGFLFYDQSREIVQDYGAARFLNIVQKFGGRYLAENNSYAKQTVAHNTVVVDKKSQYNGSRKKSQANHSDRYFFSADDPDFQYMSAKENNAYKGVNMHRTMVLLNDDILVKPVVIDVYRIQSLDEHIYDMPFYYKGHFIAANFEYENHSSQRNLMGTDAGYQHLWNDGEAEVSGTSQLTWWNGERFYTITSNTDEGDKIFFTQIGGTDPEFNLRNDQGFMIRTEDNNHVFASVLEPHGRFNPTLEYTKNSYSTFTDIKVVSSDKLYTIVNIEGGTVINWHLAICNNNPDENAEHTVEIDGEKKSWKGPITIIK